MAYPGYTGSFFGETDNRGPPAMRVNTAMEVTTMLATTSSPALPLDAHRYRYQVDDQGEIQMPDAPNGDYFQLSDTNLNSIHQGIASNNRVSSSTGLLDYPSPPLSAGTKTPPCELLNRHVFYAIDHSWWKRRECPACHHEACGSWLLMVLKYKEPADRALPVSFSDPPFGTTAGISSSSDNNPYDSVITSPRYNAQTVYNDVKMGDSSNADSDATVSEHDSDEGSHQDSIGLQNPQRADTPEVTRPSTKTPKKRTSKKKPKASTTTSERKKRSAKTTDSESSTTHRVQKDSQPTGTRRSRRTPKSIVRPDDAQNTEAEKKTQSTGTRLTILYKAPSM